jgi:hydrogenase nickel incorporation protein HypA/HybF
MHEFSMTSQIVEAALSEAEKQHAAKVIEVEVEIGDLTFLGLEQVRFAYKILTDKTIAKDSKLKIKQVRGGGKCEACDYDGPLSYLNDPAFHLSIPTFNCPRCGKPLSVTAGRECVIKRIRIRKQ